MKTESPLVLSADGDVDQYIEALVASVTALSLDISPTGFGSWSPSKLKNLACPIKFLLKNVLKASCEVAVSKDDPKYADTFLSAIGTAAHFTLERLVEGDSHADAFRKTKEAHFHKVTEEQWFRVENLSENILHFMHRIEKFSVENPIRQMHTEMKFALNDKWQPVSFFSKNAYFRGVIDLPILLENGDALVIDHKHGGSTKFGIKHHEFQLKSYAVAMATHNPKVRGVLPMIHFIQEGDLAKSDYAPRKKILEEYTIYLDSAIYGAIDVLKDGGSFKYNRGSYCDYCEFKPICHGGKRGTAGKLQPVVEASKIFFKG